MTGEELFDLTMDVLSEDAGDNADFKGRCVRLTNHMLQQTFAVNNGLRAAKGKQPLAEVPKITALTEALPYEDELCAAAFPYGLAEKFIFADDLQKAGYFDQQYISAINDARRGRSTSVIDVY